MNHAYILAVFICYMGTQGLLLLTYVITQSVTRHEEDEVLGLVVRPNNQKR